MPPRCIPPPPLGPPPPEPPAGAPPGAPITRSASGSRPARRRSGTEPGDHLGQELRELVHLAIRAGMDNDRLIRGQILDGQGIGLAGQRK